MKSLIKYIMEQQTVKTVATLSIDGNKVEINDILNYDENGNTLREFCIHNGCYSSIWLNKKMHKQPALEEVQDTIEEYFSSKKFNTALILGGGGCSVPRYILLEYPNVKVTTVELSKEVIDVANKYFLHDLTDTKNHLLVQGDAFKYVKTEDDKKYDFIFVDIFDCNKILEDVFSEDFVNNIKRIKTEDALIIYNVSIEDKQRMIDKATECFENYNIEYRPGTNFNFLCIYE